MACRHERLVVLVDGGIGDRQQRASRQGCVDTSVLSAETNDTGDCEPTERDHVCELAHNGIEHTVGDRQILRIAEPPNHGGNQ